MLLNYPLFLFYIYLKQLISILQKKKILKLESSISLKNIQGKKIQSGHRPVIVRECMELILKSGIHQKLDILF